jgi:hypothetical protein
MSFARKEGALLKRSRFKIRWNARWACASGPHLQLFNSHDDFLLNRATKHELTVCEIFLSESSSGKRFPFTVIDASGQSLELACESAGEQSAWVEYLREQIFAALGHADPSSTSSAGANPNIKMTQSSPSPSSRRTSRSSFVSTSASSRYSLSQQHRFSLNSDIGVGSSSTRQHRQARLSMVASLSSAFDHSDERAPLSVDEASSSSSSSASSAEVQESHEANPSTTHAATSDSSVPTASDDLNDLTPADSATTSSVLSSAPSFETQFQAALHTYRSLSLSERAAHFSRARLRGRHAPGGGVCVAAAFPDAATGAR